MSIKPTTQNGAWRGGRVRLSVLFLWGFALLFVAPLVEIASGQTNVQGADGVLRVGTIVHFAIEEGSGLAASRRYPGVIWTHNDGGYQFLFAVTETGEYLGAFQVVGANLIDWEAVAPDDQGNLYLADIGSNGLARTHVAVHRLKEPNPFRRYGNAEVTKTWYLRFPGLREDCESFFVLDGYGYLITKTRALDDRVTMYRYPLSSGSGSTLLEEVTRFSVTASVTDVSISTDGQRLGVLTRRGVYVILINGNPATANLAPRVFRPFINDFMEGGAFVEQGFLASAETRELWLFTNFAFQCNAPAGFAMLALDKIRIEFDATAGYRYSLESCDDLAGGIWTLTGDFFQATNNTTMFFEKGRTALARFYRLRVTDTRRID